MLDSSTEMLFGESVSSLTSAEHSEQQLFGEAFDLAQKIIGRGGGNGPIQKLRSLFVTSEFDQACRTVHDFVDKIVDRALAKETSGYKDEKILPSANDSQRYLFLAEMLKSTKDPKQLRAELLNILIAGRDTTASLLSHLFHLLARRPDILKRLYAEVDKLDGRLPNYDNLKSMKYLRYTITEGEDPPFSLSFVVGVSEADIPIGSHGSLLIDGAALRLFPVAPANARFANKDTMLPRGGGPHGRSPVYIPKGGVVAYNVWTMHRSKDIYGLDADSFRPERWSTEEALRPGWGYLPFNGGPRMYWIIFRKFFGSILS